eukprot:GSMAST32.ASY1.ANO1.772.1 assembled CDS
MLGPNKLVLVGNLLSFLVAEEERTSALLSPSEFNIDTVIVYIDAHGYGGNCSNRGKLVCNFQRNGQKQCTLKHPRDILQKLSKIYGSTIPILIISASCFGFLFKETLILDRNKSLYNTISLISSGNNPIQFHVLPGILQSVVFHARKSNEPISISQFLDDFQGSADDFQGIAEARHIDGTEINITQAINKSPPGNIYRTDDDSYLTICSTEQQGNILEQSTRVGDIVTVEQFIKLGIDLNQTNQYGIPPLWVASQNGHVEVVRLLIGNGETPLFAKRTGETPLYVASQNGHENIVQLLIDNGVDARKALTSGPAIGNTPLYISSETGHVGVVKILLRNGAVVDQAVPENGSAPLYIASQKGHEGVVAKLIDAGADVNKANDKGITPLNVALQQGHANVAQLLLDNGADIRKALKSGPSSGVTTLYIAAQFGHTRVVRLLIDAGAGVDQANDDGYTPLLGASMMGHVGVVAQLITAGANVNLASNDGITPLCFASQEGHVEVVKILLRNGADINKAPTSGPARGSTPLYLASKKGNAEVVQLLNKANRINSNFLPDIQNLNYTISGLLVLLSLLLLYANYRR